MTKTQQLSKLSKETDQKNPSKKKEKIATPYFYWNAKNVSFWYLMA